MIFSPTVQFFSGLRKIIEFINFDIFQKMHQFFYGMVVIGLLCVVGDGRMRGGRWEGVALGGCWEGVGRVLGGHSHIILDSCNDKRVSVCHV